MNIVFDLGGVVFNWQPGAFVESVFDDDATREIVRKEILEHADWIEMDRGTLTREHAIERGAARSGLAPRDIERLLDALPPFLMPVDATIKLIRGLSKTRHKLFVLSNMHLASIEYLERHHRIWSLFQGVVISSRIQMVKPERQIYEYLLQRYDLEPADTIFIDDLQENLAAASSIGIKTIRFLDAVQCASALEHALRP